MINAGSALSDAEEDTFPLSFAQQRLWLLDQLAPGRASDIIAGAFRLESSISPEPLAGALNEIVRRHEVLRTTFRTDDEGEPLQLIAPSLRVELPVVDLTGVAPDERMRELQRLTREIARRPFDLARGPLLRAQLLRVDEVQHVFVLAMHHIVSDGWSMGILLHELASLYSAFLAGRLSPLPELPVQYADYAVWQREWFQGETVKNHVHFWQRQLADLPLLQLATDHARPPVATHRGASLSLELSDRLTTELKVLSRREGVTLFMTLLGAFQILLYRYTGQEDIVVGSPTAGRNRTELEGLIGFFVNMLVMRSNLAGEPSFLEVMRRVRDVALDAFAHQDLPFEKLVEELQPTRDLSRNPLFQVAFQVFQDGAAKAKNERAESVTRLDVEKGTSNFDLSLSLWEDGDRLRGRLDYSTDLFVQQSMTRFLEHFRVLLESIVTDPKCPIVTLSLLAKAERSLLLGQSNSASSSSEASVTAVNNECVHQLFEERARQTPHALAIAGEGVALSYGELNRQANQIAHHLRRFGARPEILVALCLDRSPALVVAALGVLKAGAAYLPLDPAWPRERLEFALADSAARALLTEARRTAQLPHDMVPVLCLDSLREQLAAESQIDPESTATPGNLAYAIYTSGSTGRPKGVLIQHDGLANLVAWHTAAYVVTERDRATLLAGPAFDAAVWEIWPYLASGASLHVPSAETRDVPHAFIRWLNHEGITLSFVPTALAELLLREKWPERNSLRALLTGGDRLRRGPDSRLPFAIYNHYGPTENSVVATSAPVDVWHSGDSPLPIGCPIPGVQCLVLDRRGQLAPLGVPGELYLGGVGLARGYLNGAALTAEKFVSDPFSNLPGARLYRTGDQVRLRSDGNLEFLGRLDQQVKLRGFRIELGEVEAVLAMQPGIREIAVRIWTTPNDDQRLVAYMVAQPGETITEGSRLIAALRERARARLPEYMIPSEWMVLGALPLTPNGKVDRAALPIPDRVDGSFQTPRTPLEKEMAALWAELLGVPQVGLLDDFFRQMGGHSLLATRLVSRIRNAFGVELPLRAVFETPTVHGLSIAVVQQQAKLANEPSLANILCDIEALPDDAAGALLTDGGVSGE